MVDEKGLGKPEELPGEVCEREGKVFTLFFPFSQDTL
jgi:hypothetical protein